MEFDLMTPEPPPLLQKISKFLDHNSPADYNWTETCKERSKYRALGVRGVLNF